METIYPLALSYRRKYLLQPQTDKEINRNPAIFLAACELLDQLHLFETTRARLITEWLRPLAEKEDAADPAEVADALDRLRKTCDSLLNGWVKPAVRKYYGTSVSCDVVWHDGLVAYRQRSRPTARRHL